MMILRQSTAVDIGIGPFVDATDGVTAETALTISQADVRLKKNNGAWAQVNDNTSATHEENGWYEKELDATDTNTVGILIVAVNESGALPVWQEYQVVEEAVYDALFAGSALGYVANAPVNVAQFGGTNLTASAGRPEVNLSHIAVAAVSTTTAQLGVNAVQISGDGTAADNIEIAFDDTAGAVPHMGILDQGTAQSATGNDIVLRAGNSHANDTLIGATIMVLGSTQGYWQSALITDSVLATDTITVSPNAGWVTPSGTITYKIFATAVSSGGGGGLDAAGVRAAIGMSSANLDTQLSGIQTDTNAIEVDTQDIQSRLPAALVSGRIDSSVGAMAANVLTATAINADAITAAKLAADVTTELQSGLATAAALDVVDNFLDTEIAALTTAVADLPTNAELATALGTADDAVLAAIAALNNISTAQVNAEVDTAIQDAFNFSNGNVNANIEEINTITITGDGQVGTEFGV